MNEEEKKVVELLEHCQNTYIEDTLVTHLQLTTEEAKILLNLIEKQSKEIEELKQNRDEYKEEYIKLQNARYYNYISKDKIKEKIDLIDKEYAEFIEKNKNDLYLVNINAQRHNAMQLILEELLGE